MKLLVTEKNLVTSESMIICKTLLESTKRRLFIYETKIMPKLVILIDPRFMKEGFYSTSNAEEAAKFLENEMHLFALKNTKQFR